MAHAFTPRVEDTHPDRLLLDLDGLERLYGSAATMARELASRVSAVGLECNIGVAANPDAAMHAACGFSGITVIPAGEEAKRLGVLPLTVLLDSFDIACSGKAETLAAAREREKLREQMLDTLERWGVRDFRTWPCCPNMPWPRAWAKQERACNGSLVEPACGHWHSASRRRILKRQWNWSRRSKPRTVVIPAEPPAGAVVRTTGSTRPGRAGVEAAPATGAARRRRTDDDDAGTGCRRECFSSTDPGTGNLYTRTLRLPVAMRDPKVFLKLLQLDLAAHPPGAPVCKLWITAEPARPRSAQRGLFLPVTPEAEKLEITLARITGVVGERRAGIAKLLDTHRPDAFRMERFVSQQEPSNEDRSLTLSDT